MRIIATAVPGTSVMTPTTHRTPITPAVHEAAPAEESDDESATSYVCHFNQSSNKWECDGQQSDYKNRLLQQVMEASENADGSRATIDQLKEFGITVYLAEHDSVDKSLLTQVVKHVSASKSDRSKSDYENQRCLLYRDATGKLYNLTLHNGCSGLASTWKSQLLSFSGFQALVALTVLTRAFACSSVDTVELRPGYLSLLVGLVLSEEISNVWLNVSMFVRGTPSIAAYTILSSFDSDWPRKLTIFLLALTAAMDPGSNYQRFCTLIGIGLSMLLLAANLGARAWYFMKWRPLKAEWAVSSYVAPLFSLVIAAIAGLIFPYMGFSRIQAGGKSSVELIISNSFLVALCFMASDLDVFQNFIVAGSETCNQDNVNMTVGVFFTMTALSCIFAAQKIAPPELHPDEDDDAILVADETSPVGFKVPNFPDYPINPIDLGQKGLPCCTMKIETIVGLLVSLGVGFMVISMSLFGYVDVANEAIASANESFEETLSRMLL